MDDESMIEVGDLDVFGFRIGRECSVSPLHRTVAIYIAGRDVSPDDQAYVPSYLMALRREERRLKQIQSFERFAHLFRGCSPAQMHNLLLHEEHRSHGTEAEWEDAHRLHHFMCLQEPNTDWFSSFLLPGPDGLHLTCQCWNQDVTAFERLAEVEETQTRVRVGDLLRTMNAAAWILERRKPATSAAAREEGTMIKVGDRNRFGFLIGPNDDPQFRDVALFIAGCEVSEDRRTYLPLYVQRLREYAEELKNTLDFERFAHLFQDHNLSELHRFLLHREYPAGAAEEEWDRAALFHRFMRLNMPETDGVASFLLPGDRGLHLTYQLWDETLQSYERLEVVDGTQRPVLPYDLIRTMEEAATILEPRDSSVVERGSRGGRGAARIEVGDLNRFGFRIGPARQEEPAFRDVSIYNAGCDVTRDRNAWAPNFARALRGEAERLKSTIHFERFTHLFRDFNLSELHSILLRGEYPDWGTKTEWDLAAGFHRFLDLTVEEMDGLSSFLLPSARGLHLTYQLWDEKLESYERLEVVDGTQRPVLPYDLIRTMEEAATILEQGVAEHRSEE